MAESEDEEQTSYNSTNTIIEDLTRRMALLTPPILHILELN